MTFLNGDKRVCFVSVRGLGEEEEETNAGRAIGENLQTVRCETVSRVLLPVRFNKFAPKLLNTPCKFSEVKKRNRIGHVSQCDLTLADDMNTDDA